MEQTLTNRYHKDGTTPQNGEIFVFGSNLLGIHGAGAAKAAYQHYGAVWGRGDGFSGNSYAIPTKDIKVDTLPLDQIKPYIDRFVAITNMASGPDHRFSDKPLEFFVTRVGCGLAGYTDAQIAPMFRGANNCSFAEQWKEYLE